MTTHANEKAEKAGIVVRELNDFLRALGQLIQVASEAPTPAVREALVACCRATGDFMDGPLTAIEKLLVALGCDPEPQSEAKLAIDPATMVAFSPAELAAAPRVVAGMQVNCPRCQEQHLLEEVATIDGSVSCLLLYRCGPDMFIGAIDGHDVTQLPGGGA